jgi:lipoprotein NlpD
MNLLQNVFLAPFVLLTSLPILSSCSSRSEPAPVVELYQGKDFLDFKRNGYSGNQYVVQKGDTLFSIAWFSGNDYRDIAKLNSISRPYSIFPGQTLRLRPKAKQNQIRVNHSPGQTSKSKAKSAVDRSSKQAYGESNKNVNKPNKRSEAVEFPSRISKWMWPAKGKLISRFELSELGTKGIEISGNKGDVIVAAADGKVVYTGNALRGYGQLVIIKHSDNFLSAYAHNDALLVKEQKWIKAGQKIALMGSTGTDQVKLRFEVRYKGKSVDPMSYLPKQ